MKNTRWTLILTACLTLTTSAAFAQAPRPNTTGSNSRTTFVAVLDVAHIFNKHIQFQKKIEAVKAEIKSPGGDPTGYRVRGAVIALRREQANLIHVHRGVPSGGSKGMEISGAEA